MCLLNDIQSVCIWKLYLESQVLKFSCIITGKILFILLQTSVAKTRGGSRTAATSKMEHFVIIVNGAINGETELSLSSNLKDDDLSLYTILKGNF